jgi:hypothetical protein
MTLLLSVGQSGLLPPPTDGAQFRRPLDIET